MEVRLATEKDIEILNRHEEWVTRETIQKKINDRQIYVLVKDDEFIGWLRYGLFWDNTPFIYMLHIKDEYQHKGLGTKIVTFWENEMENKGYKVVLTSTASSETAQHFYQKLGYKAIGSFCIGNEPLELIFTKNI